MSNGEAIAQASDGRIGNPVAMEAFQRLAELWRLSTDDQIQLLGSPGRSTFFKWKKDGGTLPRDTIERISHLLAVFKALEIMLPETGAADGWVHRKNEYFQNRTALEVMLGGDIADILQVRQFVDAQRG